MSHDDFAVEPIRGLPAPLPAGEWLIWQGAPDWRSLAIRGYHARKVALYFLLLALWSIASGVSAGHAPKSIVLSCLVLAGLGAAAVGVLALLAYCNARSTVYSITNRRVLLRHGIAMPLTINIPHVLIDNAALKGFSNGTGDIALTLAARERAGYVINWPHVRPGRFARPEPSFRALTDAARAAEILAAALAASTASTATATPTAPPASTAPPGIGSERLAKMPIRAVDSRLPVRSAAA